MVFCKVLGFQVSGLRFNPNFAVFCQVFGFGSCFEVWVLGFRVEGFRVSGYRSFLRFRVSVFLGFFWGLGPRFLGFSLVFRLRYTWRTASDLPRSFR